MKRDQLIQYTEKYSPKLKTQMIELLDRVKNRNSSAYVTIIKDDYLDFYLLFESILMNNKSLFKSFIKIGIDINVRNNEGETLLIKTFSYMSPFYADYNISPEQLEMLLKASIDINAKNKNGDSILFYNYHLLTTNILKLFLKYKLDPNLLDRFGNTALMKYCIVGALEREGSGHNLTIKNHIPIDIFKILVKVTNLNIQDKDGHTALMFACCNNYKEKLVSLILKSEPNTFLKNKNGLTYYDICNNKGGCSEMSKYVS